MDNYWTTRMFGRSTDYLASARDYIGTFCTGEVVQRQLHQAVADPLQSSFLVEEVAKIDSVDDYHPNTPSSSVTDENDLTDRDKETSKDDDAKDFSTEIIVGNAVEKLSVNDIFHSSMPICASDGNDSPKHVKFYEPSEKHHHPSPYVNATKMVVINESDMSSDDSVASPKNVPSYEHTGARPKYISGSISYNSSNSAHSAVLDHSAGGRSPLSTISTHSPGWANKLYDYPILFVSPHGTIAVYLREGCIVEMTINKTVRVECQGKFSAATNAHGSTNCILHPDGRILQQDTRVQCLFGKNKVASFGPQGVIFNMKPLPMAYIVSSTIFKGTTPVPANCIRLPPMDYDFTMTVFYNQSVTGPDTVPRCQEIVRLANYKFREDGAITVLINGIFIRQDRYGNVLVNSRPRTIRASPQKNTISVRTHFVDMAVQEDEKAYVKRGVKRVHVSKSGMVVSDGNCITSMDHFGRIVSST